MPQSLFRQQALDHQGEQLWGKVILSQPVSYTLCSAMILLIVILALAFLFMNTYHRKEVVSGRLLPDKGLVSIVPPGNGRLIAVKVVQDEIIEAGQALFSIQLDESAGANGLFSTQLLDSLSDREASLAARKQLEKDKLQLNLESRMSRFSAIRETITQLEALLANERALLALQATARRRAESLYRNTQMAAAERDTVLADFLRQENAVANLDLRLHEARGKLADAQREQRVAELGGRENLLAMDNELARLRQERIRLQADIRNQVRSPLAGVVAAVNGSAGQFVDVHREVLSLIPAGAVLQAELFVPSRAVGFLNEGQALQVRFDAFPYQKFGVHAATISAISESVMQNVEGGNAAGAEPVYRVIARLRSQSVLAYGEEIPLKSGMKLSANVVLDERSLLEWLMEPLYSVVGKR